MMLTYLLRDGNVASSYLLRFVGGIFILIGSSDLAKAEPYRFQTPSRTIFCQIDSRGLACDLIAIPGSSGQLNCQQPDCNELRFFLPQIGKAFALPRSDSMAFFTKNTIPAGIKLKAKSISCFLVNDSIACRNSSGGRLVVRQFGYDLNTNLPR
jgi:hypothetical protein